jgi:hypothetical protein
MGATTRTVNDRLRSFLATPLRPQTYLNLLYLIFAFPLGLLYLIFFVVGVSLGASLAIVLIGIPIIALVVVSALGIAGFERWQAKILLNEDFGTGDSSEQNTVTGDDGQPPQADADELGVNTSTIRQAAGTLFSVESGKAVAYLPVKFGVGVAAYLIIFVLLSTSVSLVFAPLYYDQPGIYVGIVSDRPIELHPTLHLGWNRLLVTLEPVISGGAWEITRLSQALVVAGVGASATLVSLNLLNGLALLARRVTRWLLADGYSLFRVVRRWTSK